MSRVRLVVNNELAPLYRMELIREGARSVDSLEIDVPEPTVINESDKVELIQDVADISSLVMGLTFQKHLRDESGFGHDVLGSKPYARELSSWEMKGSLSDYGLLIQNLVAVYGEPKYVDRSMEFDGTRILGVENESTYELDLRSQFTFMFRLNRSDIISGTLFSKKITQIGNDAGYVCYFNEGKIYVRFVDINGLVFTKSWNIDIAESTWATVALVNDGSGLNDGMSLYINTVKQEEITSATNGDFDSLNNSIEFMIGGTGTADSNSRLTNVQVQNFKFWSTVLTDEEITAVTLEGNIGYEDGDNGYAVRLTKSDYIGLGSGSTAYYPLNGLRLHMLGKLQGMNKRSFEVMAWIKAQFGDGVEKQVIASSLEYQVIKSVYNNNFLTEPHGWTNLAPRYDGVLTIAVVGDVLEFQNLNPYHSAIQQQRIFDVGGEFKLELRYDYRNPNLITLDAYDDDTDESLEVIHDQTNKVITVTGDVQRLRLLLKGTIVVGHSFNFIKLAIIKTDDFRHKTDGWEWYIEQDVNGDKKIKFDYKDIAIESPIVDVGMLRLLWNRVSDTKWKAKMFNDQTMLAESAEVDYDPTKWGISELIIGADEYGNNSLVGLLDGFRVYKDNKLKEDVPTLLKGRGKDIEWLVKRRQSRNLMTFGGIVRKEEVEQDNKKVYIKSHGKVLAESEVRVRSYTNKTFKEIFIQLIKVNTGLTVNVEDIPDRALERYVSIGYLSDILGSLTAVSEATFRTDALGNIFIEREGLRKTDIAFIHGENALVKKRIKDDSDLVNHITIIGATQKLKEKQLVEKVTFDSNGRGKLRLNFTPLSLEVYTLDSDDVKHPLVNGDQYIINSDEREVEFIRVRGKTIPDDIVVEYTYDYIIQADVEKTDSIKKYGRHSKRFLLSWLETREDVVRYANSYLEQHARLKEYVSLEIPDLYTAIKENDIIRVVNKDLHINRDVVVKGLRWQFPQGRTDVEVGEYRFDTYDQEVQERLKIHELENLNVSRSTDVVEFIDHDIKFDFKALAFNHVVLDYNQALGLVLEADGEETHVAYYNQATYGRRRNNSYIYSSSH